MDVARLRVLEEASEDWFKLSLSLSLLELRNMFLNDDIRPRLQTWGGMIHHAAHG